MKYINIYFLYISYIIIIFNRLSWLKYVQYNMMIVETWFSSSSFYFERRLLKRKDYWKLVLTKKIYVWEFYLILWSFKVWLNIIVKEWLMHLLCLAGDFSFLCMTEIHQIGNRVVLYCHVTISFFNRTFIYA